jgi:hypothetical protein
LLCALIAPVRLLSTQARDDDSHMSYRYLWKTPEQQPIIYKSGTSPALGTGWDVMLVHTGQGSVALGRDATGKIMRKTDSVPETWEIVIDEESLRVCREYFDHRDKLHEAAADDTATFD